jgi:hypothetical protein
MSEFRCPKCGSSFFRTDIGADLWIRHCKGRYIGSKGRYEYAGCDFTWPITDDAKYGLEGEGTGV